MVPPFKVHLLYAPFRRLADYGEKHLNEIPSQAEAVRVSLLGFTKVGETRVVGVWRVYPTDKQCPKTVVQTLLRLPKVKGLSGVERSAGRRGEGAPDYGVSSSGGLLDPGSVGRTLHPVGRPVRAVNLRRERERAVS